MELTRIVKKGGVRLVAKTSYRVQGISIPDEQLFEASRARAEQLGMSFSAYVCHLIRRDLANPSDFRLMTSTGESYRLSKTPHPSLNEPSFSEHSAIKAPVNLTDSQKIALIAGAQAVAGIIPQPLPNDPNGPPRIASPQQVASAARANKIGTSPKGKDRR